MDDQNFMAEEDDLEEFDAKKKAKMSAPLFYVTVIDDVIAVHPNKPDGKIALQEAMDAKKLLFLKYARTSDGMLKPSIISATGYSKGK